MDAGIAACAAHLITRTIRALATAIQVLHTVGLTATTTRTWHINTKEFGYKEKREVFGTRFFCFASFLQLTQQCECETEKLENLEKQIKTLMGLLGYNRLAVISIRKSLTM